MRVFSGREVCKILRDHGFEVVRQRGSHIVLQQRIGETTVTVPVPDHPEIKVGSSPASSVSRVCHGACSRADGANAGAESVFQRARPSLRRGDLAGRFSLRANDQYRITFQWEQKGPYADDVTCEDYH